MNDADIETAQLEETARHESALHRKGICTHGWRQGYTPTHRPDLKPGQIQCLDCKVIFNSEEEANDARTEAMM
jgi:hypothetical protein